MQSHPASNGDRKKPIPKPSAPSPNESTNTLTIASRTEQGNEDQEILEPAGGRQRCGIAAGNPVVRTIHIRGLSAPEIVLEQPGRRRNDDRAARGAPDRQIVMLMAGIIEIARTEASAKRFGNGLA